MSSDTMALRHCVGCEDNFYNGNNPYGVPQCWSFKGAKLKQRYETGTWTDPTTKDAFTLRVVPSCFHAKGRHFSDRLPDFVRPGDVNDATGGAGEWQRRMVAGGAIRRAMETADAATLERAAEAFDDGTPF